MNAFNKLFSMLAAIVVSAVLPFSMAAESEAEQVQSAYGSTDVTSSVVTEEADDSTT